MRKPSRRHLLTGALALAVAPATVRAASPTPMTVWKTPTCGCCGGWVTHMSRAGFAPKVLVVEDIVGLWRKRGVPDALSSCHLAEVGGYTLVGHVPAADIRRLLAEKPKAIGLTVPGMPFGSPGMEHPAGRKEVYETLLLLPGGKTRVFSRHGA